MYIHIPIGFIYTLAIELMIHVLKNIFNRQQNYKEISADTLKNGNAFSFEKIRDAKRTFDRTKNARIDIAECEVIFIHSTSSTDINLLEINIRVCSKNIDKCDVRMYSTRLTPLLQ